jgi:hypothetical protein
MASTVLELPHTLIGAAIGIKTGNPYLAFPAATLSHIIVDLIPHWNPSLYTETKKHGKPSKSSTIIVIGDATLSLILGLLIASRFLPDWRFFLIVVFACFFAVLPDLIEAPYFFLNYKPKILKRLIIWQHDHQGRATKIPGILVQVLTIILALTFIFA